MSSSSYRLVLPRPWVRLPLRDGAEEAVRQLVAELAGRAPKDFPPDRVGPWRREVERRLLAQVWKAREVGAVDLYVPTDSWHGFLAGASFIVSEILRPGSVPESISAEVAEAAMVAELVGGADGARALDVAGTTWVRRHKVVPPGDPEVEGQVDVTSHRVDYVAAFPHDRERWVLVAFSCLGGAHPDQDLAGLMVELFDAIMSTWRWNPSPELVAAPG